MKNLFQVVFGTQGNGAQKAFRLPALAGFVLAALLLAGCSTGNYDNVSPIAGTWKATCTAKDALNTELDVAYPLTLNLDNATWSISGIPHAASKTKLSVGGYYTVDPTGGYILTAKQPVVVAYSKARAGDTAQSVLESHAITGKVTFSTYTAGAENGKPDGRLSVKLTSSVTTVTTTDGVEGTPVPSIMEMGAKVGASVNDAKFTKQ